jgi:hypothetical protein
MARAIPAPSTTELLAILNAHVDGESEHVEGYRRLSHTGATGPKGEGRSSLPVAHSGT